VNTSGAPGRLAIPGRTPRAGGLYGQVVEALGQDIVNGRLRIGESIYAEQLSQAFGVSRSVVRESLRTLGSMGLIEARPQVGTRVLPRSRWDLLNPMVVYWRGRGSDYLVQQREILELRLGVEAVAARFAATRMAAEQIADMRQHAEAMARALADADQHGYFEADAKFHRTLLEGSGNAVQAQFADVIDAVLSARGTDMRPEMGLLQSESVDLHLKLVEAVAARDSKRAQRCVLDILEETLREYTALAPRQ